MHTATHNTDEKRLICLFINPQKALAGISLKIDAIPGIFCGKTNLTVKKFPFYTSPSKKGILINNYQFNYQLSISREAAEE